MKHLSKTAVGRQLEGRGGPFSPLILRFLLSPLGTRMRARWGSSLLAVLAALFALKRIRVVAANVAIRQPASEGAAFANAPDASKHSTDAVETVTEDVKLPSFKSLILSQDGASAGTKELMASAVVSVLRTLVTIEAGKEMSRLTSARVANDMAAWRRTMLVFPMLSLLNVMADQSRQWITAALAASWRTTATGKLHKMYFSHMSYYRLVNDRQEVRMADPDIRMSKDVDAMCTGYASSAVSIVSALVGLVSFPVLSAGGRHWSWGFAGPVFTAAATMMFSNSMSADTPTLTAAMWEAIGKHQQMLSRIQLHGERIYALRGEGYESKALHQILDTIAKRVTPVNRSILGTFFMEEFLFGPRSCTSMFLVIPVFGGQCILANSLSAPGGPAASAPLDPRIATSHAARDIAAFFVHFWYFLNFSISAVSIIAPLLQSQGVAANERRVAELHHRLELSRQVAEELKADGGVFEHSLSKIALHDVTVQTPTRNTLVQHLSVEVLEGHSLLITGHNGAGKSSIIRCLCNLWPVPEGRISRPGGSEQAEENASLHEMIYYLPQKPCNVLGSLSDQLTYPHKVPGGLPLPTLRRWLSYVDLGYLVDRHGTQATFEADDDRDWAGLLSTGEQQALSIARLFYHHPRFAILDECTSAIPRELERRLYSVARELGMGCISIAHRPILEEYHARALRLTGRMAEDGKGWALEDTANRAALEQVRTRCANEEEVHSRIVACLAEPQQAAGAKSNASSHASGEPESSCMNVSREVLRRWPSTWRRLVAVLRLAIDDPKYKSSFFWHLGLGLSVVPFKCVLSWRGQLAWADAMRQGLCGNKLGVLAAGASYVAMGSCVALGDMFCEYHFRELTVDLGNGINTTLQRRALANGAFLRVVQPTDPRLPRLENPMQRIAETVDMLNKIVSEVPKQIAWLSMAFYVLPTVIAAGGVNVPLILALWVSMFRGMQSLAPNWQAISSKQRLLEARFQALHSRLRNFSEAVAFSGGGSAECALIEKRLNDCVAFKLTNVRKEFAYGVLQKLLATPEHLPMLIEFLLSMNFTRLNVSEDLLGAPEMIAVGMAHDRMLFFTLQGLNKFVDAQPLIQEVDGMWQRTLELVVACDAVEAVASSGAGAAPVPGEASKISVRDLDLVPARGTALAKGLSFELVRDRPAIVTGPNASGKSLLGCSLLGLLPLRGPRAVVAMPPPLPPSGRPPLETLMVSPQCIYLPSGCLGDLVCYPSSYAEEHRGTSESRMLDALRATGLEHLLAREARGWLAEELWEEVLSGGEQQRMGLARVLFRKPTFALLDECTSMVAADAEKDLYKTIIASGMTPLVLTQRLFMPDLFGTELRLGGSEAGWSIVEGGSASA